MMEKVSGEDDGRRDRPSGPRWHWILLFGFVVALAARHVWVRVTKPIRVSPSFREVEAVPAQPGSLAGANVVLVTLDTARADRIGCYGNENIRTPTLDRLASEGVIFSRASAVTPSTLPSHASILTGLYPAHHGVRTNGLFRLDEAHKTLAELLSEHGYRTGAVVSAFVLDSRFGLDQGFDHYDDDLSDCDEPLLLHYDERKAENTTDRAIEWLRRVAESRFFLWVHYFDPHSSHEPPSPYAEQYKDNPYDGEIAYVDASLGRLIASLEELEVADRTLVVVVGDHGEGLGQHGELSHATLAYESTLQVPLILRCGRRLGGGVHFARRVSHVDILQTVLSLLGLPQPHPTDGVDLTDATAPQRPVFLETLHGLVAHGWAPLVGVYKGNYKYIESPSPELFDLSRDPGEQNNLYESQPELATRLRAELPELFGPGLALAEAPEPQVNLSAAELERLAGLGYVGLTGEVPSTGSRPDPKVMMPAMNRLLDAVGHRSRAPEEVESMIAELLQVVREYPDFHLAWQWLGEAYLHKSDLNRAAEALGRCVELRPDVPEPVYFLARVKAEQGDLLSTVSLLRQVLSRYPDFLRAHYLLGETLVVLGRHPEGAEHLKRAFEIDPSHEQCAEFMVEAFLGAGRGAELPEIFQDHLAADSRSSRARIAFAKFLARKKQFTQAEAILREGVALMPDDREAVSALAFFLTACPDETTRDPAGATALLELFCERTGYRDPEAMLMLSRVYSSQNRFQEAILTAERASTLAIEAGDHELIRTLERLLIRQRAARREGVAASQPAM